MVYFIIGSGPASLAAAKGLVDQGREVTILDPGFQLEEEKSLLKETLGSKEPQAWNAEELREYRAGMQPTTKGIPKKLIYGSDYPYQEAEVSTPIEMHNAKMLRSFSIGGLSNVWGSCILPYPSNELSDWPIPFAALEEHYRAVLNFLPHSGRKDNLALKLPLYGDYEPLKLSRQAKDLLEKLEGNKTQLNGQGIYFGASRVAVQNSQEDPEQSCRYCKLCLYGCPYDLIYSSSFTLKDLVDSGKVKHISGYVVDQLEEEGTQVKIHARSAKDSTSETFTASKVFVGAGVIETTRIILESLDCYDKTVHCKHSDRFMLPFMSFRGIKGIYDEEMHTLCQAFMELEEPAPGAESAHLQLYTYNDLYRKALQNKFGPSSALFKLPIREFLSRLIVMFGYLHSNSSSYLDFTLRKGDRTYLEIVGKPNKTAKKLAQRITLKLLRNSRYLGGVPTLPFLDPPGGGNHSGGTFPMRANPKQLESDILGRPYGFQNVHIVDSSTFPSLAAATIVFTAMANAHRIATNCEG